MIVRTLRLSAKLNAIVSLTEIGKVRHPVRHHEFDEVVHSMTIHLDRVVKNAVPLVRFDVAIALGGNNGCEVPREPGF
ncbi:hypothetical protein EVA_13428 [gut metagenome]|uniref:Uncharacterized protein n=1 Tax=gut metagenome TaxID=749906 RepID=J9GGH5_9ZZZZ